MADAVCTYGSDVLPGAPGFVVITNGMVRDWLGTPYSWLYPLIGLEPPIVESTADFCASALEGCEFPGAIALLAALTPGAGVDLVWRQLVQCWRVAHFTTYCQCALPPGESLTPT